MILHAALSRASSAAPADAPLYEQHPWGAFWSLDRGAAHQVKRIRVNPKGRLALQCHHDRAERWVVIEGVATITVDDAVMKVKPGGVVLIPKGAVHRLENLTKSLVEIIEVQMGDRLGEDDIVRLDETNGRLEQEPRA